VVYRKIQTIEQQLVSVGHSWRSLDDTRLGRWPNHCRRPEPALCRLDKSRHIGTSWRPSARRNSSALRRDTGYVRTAL